jgi:hypothetical protein
MVFWRRPYHLSAEQADSWVHHEVGRLLTVDGVRSGKLTRLRTASPRQGRDYDWMLELHLAPEADGRDFVEHDVWRDWLMDMQMLGMRPTALLADAGTALRPGRDLT